MCGITGFWGAAAFSDERARAVLEAMTSALRHRGPDGDGAWFDVRAQVGFGHRRLAIIDVSPTGLQPMFSASGRYAITFNGEVYNFAAIRRELEQRGLAPVWRGSSDTEVMLAAIDAWGLEPALNRFIGMFAFGLWDGETRALHLVRDRLGVKPLFFSQTPQGLCFGSELKSLAPFPGFDTSLDLVAVSGYLRANCVPGTRSIFSGARKVAPGTFVTFTGPKAAPKTHRYWNPADVATQARAEPFRGDAREATDALEALLRDAVRLRMVSDVPLGAFLSGGVDSSSVVALMQALSDRPVRTFSIGNQSAAYDEGRAARAVARHLNTHHTALTVTAEDALAVIPQLPAMFDEPFADSSQIPTFLVSKLARRDVTVALSGDGGDELFGGYTRHVWGGQVWAAARVLPAPLRRLLGSSMASLTPTQWDDMFRLARPLVPAFRLPGIRMHKLASLLTSSEAPQRMYESLASHWLPSDGLLRPEVYAAETDDPEIPACPFVADSAESVSAYMMYRDLVGYLPDDILTKVDRASMAVSLEARDPLMDHRLVAFAWSLPTELKVRRGTGKWLLRQVLHRHVPEKLVSGPKMGFAVPLGEWLSGPLRDWAEPLLSESRLRADGLFDVDMVRSRWKEHLAGTRPWAHHLWDVLMFNAWRDASFGYRAQPTAA
ncbi:MAG: asparagine synthase (glutamine-hydrolyzing) [Archangium sp.]|nr:asparagine synthase (glutamine-hydrolyzing) [Archangium sp.]